MTTGAIGAKADGQGLVYIWSDLISPNGDGFQTEGLSPLEARDLILEIQDAIAYAEGRNP
jgi:hypothetical protein